MFKVASGASNWLRGTGIISATSSAKRPASAPPEVSTIRRLPLDISDAGKPQDSLRIDDGQEIAANVGDAYD